MSGRVLDDASKRCGATLPAGTTFFPDSEDSSGFLIRLPHAVFFASGHDAVVADDAPHRGGTNHDGVTEEGGKILQGSNLTSQAISSSPTPVAGISLPEGSWVSCKAGKLSSVRLGQDVSLYGIYFKRNAWLDFYATGFLVKADIIRDFKYRGEMFPATTSLFFYPDGSLQRAYFRRPALIGTQSIKPGQTLTFNQAGEVLDRSG